MEIGVTIWVTKPVYDIYANAAKYTKGHTAEQLMSVALTEYVGRLIQEMSESGELPGEPS